MKLKTLLKRMVGLGFILLILSSCTSPAPRDGFPTGKFTNEVAGETFAFNKDGTWALSGGSLMFGVTGTFTVDGDRYTETEVNSPFGGCPNPATYTWAFDGQELSFELYGEDDCEFRRKVYDGQIFTKLP